MRTQNTSHRFNSFIYRLNLARRISYQFICELINNPYKDILMNSNLIKNIALLFMVLEHSSALLATILHTPQLNYMLHYGGRIVFPIFVFLMIEGFFKTRSRLKYIQRIFTWAAIMSAGSFVVLFLTSLLLNVDPDSLFKSEILAFRILAPLGKNIFLSLALGLLAVYLLDQIRFGQKTKRLILIPSLVIVSISTLFSESSFYVIPLFFIFYIFYNRKWHMTIAYSLFSLIVLIWGFQNMEFFWEFEYQWMMIFALPFFLLYNGQRGKAKMKYFFYALYPLHLWIIFLLEQLVTKSV